MNHPNVVNENELEWGEQSHGEKFGYRRKSIGSTAGSERLGCSLYEVPPGRRAWPYHYHLANEEAIYVLEGSGMLRVGEEEAPVSQGDYVALPAGAEGAHQLVEREPHRQGARRGAVHPRPVARARVDRHPGEGRPGARGRVRVGRSCSYPRR